MGNIKKNRTYYFFNDMINIKDFDLSLLKIEKKIILAWYVQYWLHHDKKSDDFEHMNGVNPLYLVISKVDGYIEENNGNKYYFYRW